MKCLLLLGCGEHTALDRKCEWGTARSSIDVVAEGAVPRVGSVSGPSPRFRPACDVLEVRVALGSGLGFEIGRPVTSYTPERLHQLQLATITAVYRRFE